MTDKKKAEKEKEKEKESKRVPAGDLFRMSVQMLQAEHDRQFQTLMNAAIRDQGINATGYDPTTNEFVLVDD